MSSKKTDGPTSTRNIETGHGDSVASNIPTTVHFAGPKVDPDIEPTAATQPSREARRSTCSFAGGDAKIDLECKPAIEQYVADDG